MIMITSLPAEILDSTTELRDLLLKIELQNESHVDAVVIDVYRGKKNYLYLTKTVVCFGY